jgi:SAM-dependent methyltransferase
VQTINEASASGRHFDPILVTEDDLEDLSTFTGMSPEACLARLRSFSNRELAEAWQRASPACPEEILGFYETDDLYIWALMQWHASTARQSYRQALTNFVEQFPSDRGYLRVLDFGCGVGTDSLFLANCGYEVTLSDVDGQAFRFAQHRFKRRGIEANFLISNSVAPAIENHYDVIVCFDVFEHVPDPLALARTLTRGLRDGGLLIERSTFAEELGHPCHLTEGILRFSGLRWHIYLAGLGLRSVGPLMYRKVRGLNRLLQGMRFALWRVTGIWLLRVRRTA